MENLSISENDRILIIAPHPDDECIGTGGLLGLYSNQCAVWVLTDGAHGAADDRNMSDTRREEFISEMNMLQITDYRMFGMEDGTLRDHIDILNEESLSKYNKIFVTGKLDVHDDHRAAYCIVKRALEYQNICDTELYQYEISKPLDFISHVLDVSAVIDYKKKMIQCHTSQMNMFDYVGMALSLNRYRAIVCGTSNGYVEGYKKVENSSDSSMDELYVNLEQKIALKDKRNKLYSSWINMISNKNSFRDYFVKHALSNVAIYGCGDIGKNFYMQIEDLSCVNVAYFVDRKLAGENYKGKNIYELKNLTEESVRSCDAIIVTIISGKNEIVNQLCKCGYRKVIMLQQIFSDLS